MTAFHRSAASSRQTARALTDMTASLLGILCSLVAYGRQANLVTPVFSRLRDVLKILPEYQRRLRSRFDPDGVPPAKKWRQHVNRGVLPQRGGRSIGLLSYRDPVLCSEPLSLAASAPDAEELSAVGWVVQGWAVLSGRRGCACPSDSGRSSISSSSKVGCTGVCVVGKRAFITETINRSQTCAQIVRLVKSLMRQFTRPCGGGIESCKRTISTICATALRICLRFASSYSCPSGSRGLLSAA